MNLEGLSSLVQLPLVLAVVVVLLVVLRYEAQQDEAWRTHERERDQVYMQRLDSMQQEVHRTLVVLVLHHASGNAGMDRDDVLNYVRSGFQSPAASVVSVQ